jgi:hypothetical protein
MRDKLEGFDPFYNGWAAFEKGGIEQVEQDEAPLLMYAVDVAEPELAAEVADAYRKEGLLPADLRFGAWADAFPVPVRGESEPIGVHLNAFGGRQVRYGLATDPEKRALDVLTSDMEELVRDAIKPELGVAVFQFGRIPTMHRHVVARERDLDGLTNWKERGEVSLEARREMRDRLSSHATPERLEAISTHIGTTLRGFLRR